SCRARASVGPGTEAGDRESEDSSCGLRARSWLSAPGSQPMLVDTHCHLADSPHDADRRELLARAWSAGGSRVALIDEAPSAPDRAPELTATDPRLLATAGLHPHEASSWNRDVESELRERLRDGRVVAVGEMGLDYHYDHSPRAAQLEAFAAQLAIARDV